MNSKIQHPVIFSILTVALIFSVAAATHADEQPQKLAVLVGINDYDNTDIKDLKGCVNDANEMRRLLMEHFEFKSDNIKLLTSETDDTPTKKNIVRYFRDHLIEKVRTKKDIVVFYFSGHGSQMPDQEGGDEIFDGKDETIVPSDSREDGKFDIRDDQLNGLFSELVRKTPYVTFILDSCHSGSGIRGMGTPKRIDADERVPPPAEEGEISARGAEAQATPLEGLNYVLVAGCQPKQVSFEIRKGGVHRGALTYYFIDAIRRADNAAVTYQDVFDQIKIGIQSENFHQVPQIEGKLVNNFVFGDKLSVPHPYVIIASRESNHVVLAAGRAQGLTVKSEFDVFPPATKEFDDPNRRLARVRLTEVNPFSSVAEIVTGTDELEGIKPASRAIEREHSFGSETFPVYLLKPDDAELFWPDDDVELMALEASDALRKIRDAIDEREHFGRVTEPNAARLLVGHVGGKIKFYLASGEQVSQEIAVNSAELTDQVTDEIEHWTRWYNIRAIKNHRSKRIKVSVSIVPDHADFEDGDECTIVVENVGSRDLFLIVLIISTDGSVNVLYPPSGHGEPLARNEDPVKLEIGLSVPGNYKKVTDVVKVIASDQQLNYAFLELEGRERGGLRAVPNANPLIALLEEAAAQTTTRHATLKPVEDWFTDAVSYQVTKPGN